MKDIVNLLPTLLIGVSCTFIGIAKIYGLAYGIEGGPNKKFSHKLCGS